MAKSKYSELFADPWLMRELLRRLSGIDADYDAELIKSFAEAAELTPGEVWLAIKGRCLPCPRRSIH